MINRIGMGYGAAGFGMKKGSSAKKTIETINEFAAAAIERAKKLSKIDRDVEAMKACRLDPENTEKILRKIYGDDNVKVI